MKTGEGLFSEFGFSGVSMSDIAKRMGITKAAIYFHFKGKKDLYFRILDREFQELKEKIKKETSGLKGKRSILRGIINVYLKSGRKNLILGKYLRTEKEIEKKIRQISEKVESLISKLLHLPRPKTSLFLGLIEASVLKGSISKKDILKISKYV